MSSKTTISTPRRSTFTRSSYVVCVSNEGYAASLEKRKIYRRLPNAAAKAHNLLRVVDESGEDYLYPANWFMPITLSPTITRALASAL